MLLKRRHQMGFSWFQSVFYLLCADFSFHFFLLNIYFIRWVYFYVEFRQNWGQNMIVSILALLQMDWNRRLKNKSWLTIFLHLEVVIYFPVTNRHNNFIGSFTSLRVQGVRKLQYFTIRCLVEPLSNPVVVSILLNKTNGRKRELWHNLMWEMFMPHRNTVRCAGCCFLLVCIFSGIFGTCKIASVDSWWEKHHV